MNQPDHTEAHVEVILAQLVGNPLSRILRSAGLGTWSWDLASDVFSWSVGTANEVGLPQLRFDSIDELVGFAHVDDQAQLRADLLRCRSAGDDIHDRFRYLKANGDYGRVLIDGICVGPGVPPTSVVGISRDESDQMDAETRLADLFTERNRVAQALETALLPPTLPTVAGIEVDAAYLSSEGPATGDFYDFFPLRNGDWALTIGDVGGHGPAAAAITAAIRYALRAAALSRRNPVRVLEAANQAHFAAAEGERFTTCHFVRMARKDNGDIGVRVGTAGHPTILVRRATGEVEELTGTGPMLGLTKSPDFAQQTAVLSGGDIMVLYTDGLVEARRNDDLFGIDRLRALIGGWAGPIDGMARHLQEHAAAFGGGDPQDDMATVVVRVPPVDDVDRP